MIKKDKKIKDAVHPIRKQSVKLMKQKLFEQNERIKRKAMYGTISCS